MVLLKMAHSAWLEGKSVLVMSMEMGSIQVARRIIGMQSSLDPRLIQAGRLSTYGEQDLTQCVEGFSNGSPFRIIAGNFEKSIGALRAAVETHLPDCIYVDAAYLLTPESGRRFNSRHESKSAIVEGLKKLALDVNRPIVNTFQFNRKGVRKNTADTSDVNQNPVAHLGIDKIAETDAVGQASSIVMGLELGSPPRQRDSRYIGILKGREGESGWFRINYRFRPVDMTIMETDRDDRTPHGAALTDDLDIRF